MNIEEKMKSDEFKVDIRALIRSSDELNFDETFELIKSNKSKKSECLNKIKTGF